MFMKIFVYNLRNTINSEDDEMKKKYSFRTQFREKSSVYEEFEKI